MADSCRTFVYWCLLRSSDLILDYEQIWTWSEFLHLLTNNLRIAHYGIYFKTD
jgi:hypothetical protein